MYWRSSLTRLTPRPVVLPEAMIPEPEARGWRKSDPSHHCASYRELLENVLDGPSCGTHDVLHLSNPHRVVMWASLIICAHFTRSWHISWLHRPSIVALQTMRECCTNQRYSKSRTLVYLLRDHSNPVKCLLRPMRSLLMSNLLVDFFRSVDTQVPACGHVSFSYQVSMFS